MDAPATRQRPPDTDEPAGSRDHSRFIAAVVIVAAAGLWVPQLTSSFWADETATHWIISDGVKHAVTRSLQFEGESPFYFIIQSGVKAVFGSSELALRLPSLLAMIAATILLWRLGRRLIDDDAGLLATVVLVATPGVTFAAGDARPYGFAILLLVGSTLALVRWTDTGSRRDAVAYVVLTAAALYMHYFTLTALAVHPFYVWRRRGRVRPAGYGVAVACIGLMMIPVAPHIAALFHRRASLQIKIPVSLENYFLVLLPPLLIGSIVFGALIARRWNGPRIVAPDVTSGTEALALGWWIIPPTILYAVTRVGSTTLFEPRFFFFALPGLALAGGLVVRLLESPRARRVVAVAIAVGALVGLSSKTHSGEDWRAVARAERSLASPDTPVLFRPNFIESAQIDWLEQPEKRAYLLSVLSPYPMIGTIVPIPYDLTPDAKAYLDPVIAGALTSAKRFLLVNDRGRFQPWLEGKLPDFTSRRVPGGGLVTLVMFEKRSG